MNGDYWSGVRSLTVVIVFQEKHPLDQHHHLAGFSPDHEPDTDISGEVWPQVWVLYNILLFSVPGGDRDAGQFLHCLCGVLASQPHEVSLHHAHPLQSVHPTHHCLARVLLQCKTQDEIT